MWGCGEMLGEVWKRVLGCGVRGSVERDVGECVGEVWKSVLGCGEV